jgi:RNA methyltransferase, TrmH family
VALITSRQHAIVKAFRRAARGDPPLVLLDGWHLLSDALAAGVRIETIAIAERSRDAEAERIVARARAKSAAVVDVSAEVMDALSPVQTPTGVAALIEPPTVLLSELFRPAPALIVLAIDMQDPGNVGALIRAAEAGGATGVALAGSSADPWGWKALRASMGSTFRIPVVKSPDVAPLLNAFAAATVRIVATVPRGGVAMHDADFRSDVAIMMGGEGAGLPQALIDAADDRVSIPMHGRVESLNVAVAAALLVYEARRQRHAREALT